MRLLKVNIDGFGKWTDTTFHLSESALYCFYGDNESGKSTLQQFILYMLFGLAPKKRKLFIPKKRNGIGGTLTVYDEQLGMITVQRTDGNFICYLDDGVEQNETWWIEQLKGISKEVYTSVNAFSATDLEAIRTMDYAAVSDILFSIGLSGSTAIYEVEKQLSDQLDALYKRRGKNPLMNEQIEKVTRISESLYHARNSEASYAPLMSQKEEEQTSVEIYEKQLESLKTEMIILDKTIQSLPQIQTFQRHQEELETFPVSLFFPREGVQRYQQLKDKLLPKTSEYNLLKEKQQEYEKNYESIKKDMLTEKDLEHAKDMFQEKSEYRHRQKSIEQQRAAMHHEEEHRDQLVYELGWGWDEAKGTILPFHLESSWQQLADDQQAKDKEQTSLEEKQHLLEEKRFSLLHDEKEIRNRLLADDEQRYMEERLSTDKHQKDNKQQKKNYESWKIRQKERMKKLLYLYASLSGLSVVFGLTLNITLFYVIALLIAIGAGLQYFYTGTNAKAIESMFLSGEVGKVLSEQERHSFEKKMQQEQALQLQLSAINQEIRQNNLLQIQVEEQQQIMDKRSIQLDDRKESERFTYPFLQDVEVAHWPGLLKLIRELQRRNQTVSGMEKDILAEIAKDDVINEQLKAFPYAGSFNELETLLEKQTDLRIAMKRYQNELETISASLFEITKHIETLQMERDDLFQSANASNEEDFYKTENDYTRKESLIEELSEIRIQMYRLYTEEHAEELLASKLDSVALESKKEQLEIAIKENEEAKSRAYHQLGEIQAKIHQLEDSKDVSELTLTYEMEKNLLNEQAKEWAVLKLVQTALRKTKQTYQEKHFSKVMELTGSYFETLTNGRYYKVYPPKGTGLFQVEGSSNIRYTVEELSQGTIDQLYVALRFAIANAMREQFDLPLLIDDAFVHFDNSRTTQTIHLLEQLSEEQQVIFFTCKEDIAEQFQNVYPMKEAKKITI